MRPGQPMPHAGGRPGAAEAESLVEKALPVLSIFTMVMTVPQIWSVWVRHQTSGVSLLSWGAYFLSAVLWTVYGLHKGDKKIWVACIGWMVLDGAVFIGLLVRG
jgi:uncharacterized protein with PQ loop repeat